MSRWTATALVLALVIPYHANAQMTVGGPSLHAFGFGDVNFATSKRGDVRGFVLGQAVGHVSAALTDRFAFFGEVSVTGRNTGYTLEIERLIARYDFADVFKLSVGRYHTPVSYWNTAFHHGLWLQTSVARPQLTRFGSRFVPVHFVGVLAEGTIPTGAVGLGYTAGVGNGRQSDNIARGGDAGDTNTHRAWMAGLTVRPATIRDLQVGGSVYSDRVGSGSDAVDERILSAHAVLMRESPELIGEFVRVRHELLGDPRTSDGYYVQAGYRLPGGAHQWKPYVRWERVDVADDDVLLPVSEVGYAGVIAGLRFDFADYAALKAEYRNDRIGSGERFDSLWLQVSFAVSGSGGGARAMHSPAPPQSGGAR